MGRAREVAACWSSSQCASALEAVGGGPGGCVALVVALPLPLWLVRGGVCRGEEGLGLGGGKRMYSRGNTG